jgi:hypothetical protein
MWKRILWERTGGYYMFYTGLAYFLVGMYNIFVEHFVSVEVAQVVWVATLAFPFAYPPLGRWLNMDITWDQKMFNWFSKREYTMPENVVPFPEPKLVPPMPKVEPPKSEKPVTTFYRIGLTDNNRISFQMGYSEITMTAVAIDHMIAQLEVFRDQLYDETQENDDGN